MQEFFRTIEELAAARRPEAMLEVLIRRLGAMLGAAHCACIGISDDRRHARLIALAGNPELRNVPVDLFRYPEAVEAAVTGRTVYAPEVLRDRLFLTHLAQWPDAPEAHEIESVAAVPLLTRHGARAVVVIRTRRGDTELSREQLTLVEQLVSAAVVLLDRGERSCAGLDALDRRLRDELERVRRYGSHLSFALLDFAAGTASSSLDDASDRGLSELGAFLQKEVRAPDFVTRYLGPTFALLLPSTGLAEARLVLFRLATALDRRESFRFAAGLVCYPKPGINRIEDLLAAAEAALIRGKTIAPDGVGMLDSVAA